MPRREGNSGGEPATMVAVADAALAEVGGAAGGVAGVDGERSHGGVVVGVDVEDAGLGIDG